MKLGPADVVALIAERGISKIVSAKGKAVDTLAVKDADEASLLALLIGPTGNLRAPAAIVGKTLLVGFNPESYAEVLG